MEFIKSNHRIISGIRGIVLTNHEQSIYVYHRLRSGVTYH